MPNVSFRLALALMSVYPVYALAGEKVPSQAEIRTAAREGLALVEKAAANYPKHRECFSCHHQTLPMLAMVEAGERGLGADRTLLRDQGEFTLESFADKRAALAEGKGVGGGAMTVGYALWALHLAGQGRDETTDAMVSYLLKTQRRQGYWSTGGRPPLEESVVSCTVLAAAGLKWFAPESRKAEAGSAAARALAWVGPAETKVQEDRTFRLAGMILLGGNPRDIPEAREAVLKAQHEDGGWSSRDDLPPDAYATGQALYWLRASGMAPDGSAYRRGVNWLLSSRQADGSWRVETRSRPVQVYFDNGDPHGKHQFISTPATAWAAAALVGALVPGEEAGAAEPFDLIIRNGKVVDGTGNPWFLGDVGIRGDRIAAVGRLPDDATAGRVIDARGKAVAPGFIDMHSHSDMPLLEDGAALGKVTQGVTTEVLGEDTSGGPAKGKRGPATFRKGEKTLSWTTLGGYFDALEGSGTAVNVASYVGLGTLLGCVKGDALDRPTPSELADVKALLEEALTEGAFGLSTMLAGPRELNVTTADLVELAGVVKRHGGIYSSHIRNEGTEVLAAVEEAISVGEKGGIPVDIIHLKIADRSLWGRMDELVLRIEAARRRGVNVQANVYPYTRGNNDLVTIVPPWAHEGGTPALLDRLRDPAQRERVKADIRKGLPGWYNHFTAVGGDWSRMLVSARLSPANARFQGKTMDAILAERGGKSADSLDRFLDFLIEENGSVSTIYAHHAEADMNLAMSRPWCSIGSDGSALAVEGPLRRGHPHPRSFGTFPRVLGVYARQRGLLTLEEAVRKMTSQNAAKLGITDRGLIRAGQFADVVIFDPETVIDRATYLDPFQYSAGVETVLVNGRPVLEQGKPTGQRPGRAIRHGRGS